MKKIKIQDTEFADFDIYNRVCSHLKPILDYLEKKGYTWNRSKPLESVRGSTNNLIVDKDLDFTDIYNNFEFPPYIHISPESRRISCRKCWCAISDRKRP